MQRLRIALAIRIRSGFGRAAAAGQKRITIALAALLAALFLAVSGAAAQMPDDASADVDAEEVGIADFEDLMLDGEESLLDGEFHAAIEKFRSALALEPSSLDVLAGLYDCYRAIGDVAEQDAISARLVELAPDSLDFAILRAEYLFYRGRVEESEALFRKVIEKDPNSYGARVGLGRLLRSLGRDDAADREFRAVANHASTEIVSDAERLTWLGHAYWQLGGFEDAAMVFTEAIRDDRLYIPARLGLADLFREKYQTGDSLKEYRLALKVAPNNADLIYGIAMSYYLRERDFQAQNELRRALEINPNHVESLARLAQAQLEDRSFDRARETTQKALDINPEHRYALSLRAASAFVASETTTFEELEKRVLAIDPTYGRFYLTLADVLGGLYRFPDALPYAKKAIQIDPRLWEAYDLAGRFAFHVGQHDQAVKLLQSAQKGDNFKFPWRLNMLEVATLFGEFISKPSEHFQIFIHVDENEVMRVYLEELLEQAYDELTRRYRITPDSRTIVEVYPSQDDFAVRNVGTTGIDLILGICFGRVFTMNSPRAKPPGFFSWAQTAWHEYAHVLTIQATRARIPRWLTEGISVYEERRANPLWERRQEQELLDAYYNDKIFPLRELNSAFRTPRIGFAYYQGSLLVEFIEGAWGFDSVLEILRLYGEDMTTENILLEVVQLTPEAFDKRFLAFIKNKIDRFRIQPRWDRDRLYEFADEAELDPDNAELQAKLAWAYYYSGADVDCEAALGRALEADEQNPLANLLRGTLHYDKGRLDRAERYLKRALDGGAEDAVSRLRLAQIYENQGKIDEAVREYKRSKRGFPYYVGPGNAYARLEAIYRSREQEDDAYMELAAYAQLVNTDIESRKKLAAYYREKGDTARCRTMLEELLWIDPFELVTHVSLADIYKEEGRRALEVRELRVSLALVEGKDRKVELLQRLVDAEVALGRLDDARFHLEEAIRLAPDKAELKRMLDEISSS